MDNAGRCQLARPGKARQHKPGLSFSSDDGLELAYNEVINHLLLERKKLPGTRRLEGWLLGVGGLMPVGLRHGQVTEMHLTILGASHAEYSTTLSLWTERLPAQTKNAKTRKSLFAKPQREEHLLADRQPSAEAECPLGTSVGQNSGTVASLAQDPRSATSTRRMPIFEREDPQLEEQASTSPEEAIRQPGAGREHDTDASRSTPASRVDLLQNTPFSEMLSHEAEPLAGASN